MNAGHSMEPVLVCPLRHLNPEFVYLRSTKIRSTATGYDRRWANGWMPRNVVEKMRAEENFS